MIAPQSATGSGPSHEAIRANQLIEAGLWLRLGGDDEGARRLFMRALAYDPSNRRAREWLAKSNAARTAASGMGASPSDKRPAASVSPDAPRTTRPAQPVEAVAHRPAVEVSVIVLDEKMEVAPTRAAVPGSRITADVLAFLSENESEAPRPAAPVSVPTPRVEPSREVATLLQGVEELLALGDPSSAMELLRKAEQLAPGDPRLMVARERCAREQQAALEAKLGDLKRVPLLKLRMADLMRLSLDPRAGFLLSRIDGRLSYEALFSVSGMSRLDTLRFLVQLLDQGIITVR